MARRSSKSKTTRKIDFSEEVKWFEADMEYAVEVKAATWEDGQEHAYIAIEFKGVEDEHAESTLYHNASISPKALHRTRAVLEALGYDIEDGEPLEIDTDDLVGRQCMIHTFEDKYKGNDGETKTSVKADDFWPMEDAKSSKGKKKASKDDDEDDKKSSKRGGKKKAEPEPIAVGDVPDDRDELDELVEKYGLEIEMTRKLKKDDDAFKEAVIEALEAADMIEEEKKSSKRGGKKDEDEDDTKGKGGRSSRGSKKSSGKSKSWSEEEISEMSEEDLDEVVEQAKLDLDLSDHKTLRKKKNAVVDALEEAGNLKD